MKGIAVNGPFGEIDSKGGEAGGEGNVQNRIET